MVGQRPSRHQIRFPRSLPRLAMAFEYKHSLLYTGRRLHDFYDGRHKRRAGVGTKFTGREEQGLASLPTFVSPKTCCFLEPFFELENQNRGEVAYLKKKKISRCLNEGFPSVSDNCFALCSFSTTSVYLELGKGKGK